MNRDNFILMLLAIIFCVELGTTIGYVYQVTRVQITFTIKEPISVTPSAEQTVSIYPGETTEFTYVLSNAGSVDVPVSFHALGTYPEGVSISFSPESSVIVPHGESVSVLVTVAVSTSSPACTFQIQIEFTR